MSLKQEGETPRATEAQVKEQIEALNRKQENFEGWRLPVSTGTVYQSAESQESYSFVKKAV